MEQDGGMVRTGGHLGSDGKAEDVANDSVDADGVGETWLQLRDGDTTPISRHPLLELEAPRGRRLVRDHIFCHCHRPVPFQLNGPVADTSHSQVLGRGSYREATHRQHELRGPPSASRCKLPSSRLAPRALPACSARLGGRGQVATPLADGFSLSA